MQHAPPMDWEPLLARFGLRGFRTGQREVIETVLAGHDCLCVMPTGGGKSLCYQLPAISRPGVVLVVSPLIALMKDQVDQLQRLGLRATYINSTLPAAEQFARLAGLEQGAYDLVYVVPERFRSSRFVDAARSARVQLLAIDEAHCISEWGHDFRPDYARLGQFRQQIGDPPTIALTATATPAVQADIARQLTLREPRSFVTGFSRPNLHYEIHQPGSLVEKNRLLERLLGEMPGAGIIYASTRKRCEEVAETIRENTGRRATVYHAGLPNEERRQAQDDFMAGRAEVVVATNAFGMGIDKADVRFVIHYNMPGSIEAYYQEAGRAGRDGQPARCVMLYSHGDRRIQEFFIDSAYPPREVVKQVYDFLSKLDQDPIELTQQEIKEHLQLNISGEGVGTCEQLLEGAGVLERLDSFENLAIVRLNSDAPTLLDFVSPNARSQRRVLQALERIVGPRRFETVYFNPRQLATATELDAAALARALRELRELESFDYVPPFRGRAIHMRPHLPPFHELLIDWEKLNERKAREHEKVARLVQLAQTATCRQARILAYFGEPNSGACGHCDVCAAGEKPQAGPAPQATSNPQLERAARLALSTVAARSRFGKTLMAQTLCGSKSAQVQRFGLSGMEGYASLAGLKVDDAARLLTALVEAGCLESFEQIPGRPILRPTGRGRELLADDSAEFPSLSLPRDLIARIGALRHAVKQSSPKTTAPITAKPHAEAKREPAPQPPSGTPQSSQPPEDQSAAPPSNAPARPSHYWTWKMLSQGFSVDDCAEARGVARAVVLDHALRALDEGWRLEPAWFFNRDQLVQLEGIVGEEEPSRESLATARLPAGIRLDDVHLFVCCRRAARAHRPARGAASAAAP